ncbi:cytochrome P450 4C1-like [Euwallacea fornicatus]|uniref:cytochrome P450 4C1-like n=1 Tax=Euwallacea fornicatus TaxID=995702 RepID=UPI00338F75C0
MLLILLLLVVLLLLPILKIYINHQHFSRYIDHLPGEKKYPVIGTMWISLKSRREDLADYLLNRHKKFGPIYRQWMGNLPMVCVYKPEHAQTIFKNSCANHKGQFYQMLTPWLGNGLISGSGPTWQHHRKIISPSFHFKVLDSYVEIFTEKAEQFSKYLEKYEGQGYFNVTTCLTKISLDIIAESAMGVELNYLSGNDPRGMEYAQAIIDFSAIFFKRMANPLYRNNFTFRWTALGRESARCVNTIQQFNNEIIQERKRRLHENKEKTKFLKEDDIGSHKKTSFLDLLLRYQNEHRLSKKEIQDEVSTFMFGGLDTTTATVTYALLALGNNAQIQKHVQEELDEIFAGDPGRKVTLQDISRMEYLDRVIKEVLRCYNFVPSIYRELQSDLEVAGITLPKGINVGISLNDLHHDPAHYPDPYKFDPDRFLPEICAQRHPYAYVPFSAGARNCLGQKFAMRNVKMILSYILRQYHVKCLEKPEDLKYFVEIVLRPQNGLHIALESRRSRRTG